MGQARIRHRADLTLCGPGEIGQDAPRSDRLENAAASGTDQVVRLVERAIAETLAMPNPQAWRSIEERFVAAGLPPEMARILCAHAWPERQKPRRAGRPSRWPRRPAGAVGRA